MPGSLRIVLSLGTAQMLGWGSSYYLLAMLAVPMGRELGLTTPTVFAAFSLALVVSALLGPHAGRAIDRFGGRPVLMASSLVFAAALAGLGASRGPWSLFLAWMVMGVAMSCGLYEAAFSSLVRLWGTEARGAITGITLLGGFASTLSWPLSSWLEAEIGWRGACFVWAALHLVVGLPLNMRLPTAARVPPLPAQAAADPAPTVKDAAAWRATVCLSFVFAATWFISTAMASHLPRLLQLGGVTLATAVMVGALLGPAQVGARMLEFGLLRKLHPLLSARLAAAMHPIGVLAFVFVGAPAAAVFGVLHGAGNGILTIANGTLPLAIFGPQGFGQRQGVLMVPARVVQALAPWLYGLCLDRWGVSGALALSGAVGTMAFMALFLLPRRLDLSSRGA